MTCCIFQFLRCCEAKFQPGSLVGYSVCIKFEIAFNKEIIQWYFVNKCKDSMSVTYVYDIVMCVLSYAQLFKISSWAICWQRNIETVANRITVYG